jgi:hypothetical protein
MVAHPSRVHVHLRSGPMKRVPWFLVACFVLAYLGGGFTVGLCAIAVLIYIPLASLRWWAERNHRKSR